LRALAWLAALGGVAVLAGEVAIQSTSDSLPLWLFVVPAVMAFMGFVVIERTGGQALLR
jgi:hypothetical protein